MAHIAASKLHILTGNHHPELASRVAERLGISVLPVKLNRFANGEIGCQIKSSVRGADIFILQTHSNPINDALMEQAILVDAAKRAAARHITAVCPFMGYARQDRKSSGREPISAKLVVNILKIAGADRIASIDLHTGQIQGFFDGPFEHLIAMPVLIKHIKKILSKDCVVVSPDAGRVKLAERYAKHLNADLAIIHKRRQTTGNAAYAQHLIGEVNGRDCVVVDDMIDGAGTICAAAEQLKRHGASNITAVATHGLFSPPAKERLEASAIDRLIVTDTLPISIKIMEPKITVLSVADIIADAISAIFEERSVSAIFRGENQG